MKNKKLFLLPVLSFLCASTMIGCSNNNTSSVKPTSSEEQEEEPRDPTIPLEVGDIAKQWKSRRNSKQVPLLCPEDGTAGTSDGRISDELGEDDNVCLDYIVTPAQGNKGYLTNLVSEKPFFNDSDVTNGDIISLYAYVPSNSNLFSLQLEVTLSSNTSLLSNLVEVSKGNEDKWVRLMLVFDSNDIMNEMRVNFETINNAEAYFYLDTITITFGEETEAGKSNYEYNDESLWRTYEHYFKVGTCLASRTNTNQTMRKITRDNFNSVTAENEGKPEQILDQAACQELAKSNQAEVAITLKPFEKIYDFCEACHIGVRHHTFVWYSQTPAWFFNEGYQQNGKQVSRDIMLQRMENFIRVTLESINARWPGLVYAIDVSNEAVDNHQTRSNNNNWYTVVGPDFVYYAFKYASAYKDEEQELYYNDYSFDYDTENCKYALNTLLKETIEEGLIDGVGIQGHIDSNSNMDVLINDAKMIYEKGLKCQITELDITTSSTNEAGLNSQKDAYKDLIIKVLRANAAQETDINAVILWGITDNTSWKSYQNPLLFDNSFNKKPAYYGFLEAINEY